MISVRKDVLAAKQAKRRLKEKKADDESWKDLLW